MPDAIATWGAHQVEIFYPASIMGPRLDTEISAIAFAHGGRWLGSGTDLLDRDICFRFKSEFLAKTFAQRIFQLMTCRTRYVEIPPR
jgi:hypothetical protein